MKQMWPVAVVVLASVIAPASAESPQAPPKQTKPKITLKALPQSGITPFRVVVTAELTGGSDDFEDFYCAMVEWDWGDGTKSESKADCDPYERGKSTIARRFTQDHTYHATSITASQLPDPTLGASSSASDPSGNMMRSIPHRIKFSLKQKNKTVASTQTTVEVRPGIR
jgi:hypothetical protein